MKTWNVFPLGFQCHLIQEFTKMFVKRWGYHHWPMITAQLQLHPVGKTIGTCTDPVRRDCMALRLDIQITVQSQIQTPWKGRSWHLFGERERARTGTVLILLTCALPHTVALVVKQCLPLRDREQCHVER